MTPADELRAAAELLRERSREAGPGPWTVTPPERPGALNLIEGEGWAVARAGMYEAPYIALMSPVVGLAVADWLDATADRLTFWVEPYMPDGIEHALAVARACLGTHQNEEAQR